MILPYNRLDLLEKEPLSVKDISSKLNVPTDEVLNNIVILRKNNFIALDKIENFTPTYISIMTGGE